MDKSRELVEKSRIHNESSRPTFIFLHVSPPFMSVAIIETILMALGLFPWRRFE